MTASPAPADVRRLLSTRTSVEDDISASVKASMTALPTSVTHSGLLRVLHACVSSMDEPAGHTCARSGPPAPVESLSTPWACISGRYLFLSSAAPAVSRASSSTVAPHRTPFSSSARSLIISRRHDLWSESGDLFPALNSAQHGLAPGKRETSVLQLVADVARVRVRLPPGGSVPEPHVWEVRLLWKDIVQAGPAHPAGCASDCTCAQCRACLMLQVAGSSRDDVYDWMYALTHAAALASVLPISISFSVHPYLLGWAAASSRRLQHAWPWMFTYDAAGTPVPAAAQSVTAPLLPPAPPTTTPTGTGVTTPVASPTRTRTRSRQTMTTGSSPAPYIAAPTPGAVATPSKATATAMPTSAPSDLLGAGAFGRVYMRTHARTRATVAVKRLPFPPVTCLTADIGYIPRDVERRWKVVINELLALERCAYLRAYARPQAHARTLFPCPYLIEYSVAPPGVDEPYGAMEMTMPCVTGDTLTGVTAAVARDGVIHALPRVSEDVGVIIPAAVHTRSRQQESGGRGSVVQLAQYAVQYGPSCVCLAEAAARVIVHDVAQALHMLHRIGIVHRDVKPDNVQVCAVTLATTASDATSSREARHTLRGVLLDLGFAHLSQRGGSSNWLPTDMHTAAALATLFGTRHSAAPEIWMCADTASALSRDLASAGNSARTGALPTAVGFMAAAAAGLRPDAAAATYTSAVDVWGLGVVMFQALFSVMPFDDTGGVAELKANICAGTFIKPEPAWSYISHEARDLLATLLNVNAAARPNTADVLRHAWFRKM